MHVRTHVRIRIRIRMSRRYFPYPLCPAGKLSQFEGKTMATRNFVAAETPKKNNFTPAATFPGNSGEISWRPQNKISNQPASQGRGADPVPQPQHSLEMLRPRTGVAPPSPAARFPGNEKIIQSESCVWGRGADPRPQPRDSQEMLRPRHGGRTPCPSRGPRT